MVSTSGALTEPIWKESGAVELVDAVHPGSVARAVVDLLARPDRLAELSTRARELYAARFALDHTVTALRDHAA
jgi:hypothetical protein